MTCFETLNFVVNLVIAIGTILAVIVALFGENIKNALCKAKLSIELGDPKGELTIWSSIPYQLFTPIENLDLFSGSESIGTTFTSVSSDYSGPKGPTSLTGYPNSYGATGTSGSLNDTQQKIIGNEVIYYHLKVINHRHRIPVSKCRVILKEIHLKDPETNDYKKLTLTVPPRFQWAPAETSPPAIDFIDEQILDFGYLQKGSKVFMPSLSPRFNNFQGNLKANQIIKYTLEIQANNARSVRVEIEVTWDGNWTADLEKMRFAMQLK